MAIFNGEVIFKVKFKDQAIPVMGYTKWIAINECAKEVFIRHYHGKDEQFREMDEKRENYEIVIEVRM